MYRQSGKFLIGWLLGVAIGAAVLGGGFFAFLSHLSDDSNSTTQPVSARDMGSDDRQNGTASTQVSGANVASGQQPAPSQKQTPPDAQTELVNESSTEQMVLTGEVPRAAPPPSPAYVRLPTGEVLPVPEGETIDSVLEAHAERQDLQAVLDPDREDIDEPEDDDAFESTGNSIPASEIVQQQEEILALRQAQETERAQYEARMRAEDEKRLQTMLELDRKAELEDDDDDEAAIAPRIPD